MRIISAAEADQLYHNEMVTTFFLLSTVALWVDRTDCLLFVANGPRLYHLLFKQGEEITPKIRKLVRDLGGMI